MKWKQYRIKTTTAAEDLLSSLLEDLGVEGVLIEDNIPITEQDMAQMFIDIIPEGEPDIGEAWLSFYLEENAGEEELLQNIRAGIAALKENGVDVGEAAIEVTQTDDADWQDNWKEFFHSFYIEDMLIHPSWEKEENEKGGITISIDPGISFGTGKHETTQLFIRALREYVKPGASVLDLGCGSGILSIVSSKLGAGIVRGTDIDPDCITSVEENYVRNDLAFSKDDFFVGNLISDEWLQKTVQTGAYDVVAANILADVIIPMAKEMPACMKDGGILIASGIIDTKEEAVKEAIEAAGLKILSVRHQGEWVGIVATKE